MVLDGVRVPHKRRIRQQNLPKLLVSVWQALNPQHQVLADPGFWNGPDWQYYFLIYLGSNCSFNLGGSAK